MKEIAKIIEIVVGASRWLAHSCYRFAIIFLGVGGLCRRSVSKGDVYVPYATYAPLGGKVFLFQPKRVHYLCFAIWRSGAIETRMRH